jgi:hypothetical protein
MTKAKTGASAPASKDAAATAAASTSAPATNTAAASAETAEKVIYGSDTLSNIVQIGGKDVPVADVVNAAFAISGLTLEEWNALEGVDRDKMLALQIADMETEAQAAADASAMQTTVISDNGGAMGANHSAEQPSNVAQGTIKVDHVIMFDASIFPLELTLRNNSPIPIVETASGAYVGNGSSASIIVQSEQHLMAIRESLEALADLNYFDRDKLVIDGLPVIADKPAA